MDAVAAEAAAAQGIHLFFLVGALLFALLNFLTVKPNKYNPIKIHSCHTCSARTIRPSIFFSLSFRFVCFPIVSVCIPCCAYVQFVSTIAEKTRMKQTDGGMDTRALVVNCNSPNNNQNKRNTAHFNFGMNRRRVREVLEWESEAARRAATWQQTSKNWNNNFLLLLVFAIAFGSSL